jgi:hypothetical protein
VYRARLIVFVISILLAWIKSLSKGYVFRGQGQDKNGKHSLNELVLLQLARDSESSNSCVERDAWPVLASSRVDVRISKLNGSILKRVGNTDNFQQRRSDTRH